MIVVITFCVLLLMEDMIRSGLIYLLLLTYETPESKTTQAHRHSVV